MASCSQVLPKRFNKRTLASTWWSRKSYSNNKYTLILTYESSLQPKQVFDQLPLSLLFFVFICLTSGLGDVCPGFQSQGGYVSTLACRFLRLCTIALDLQGVFLQVGRGLVLKVMKIRIPL